MQVDDGNKEGNIYASCFALFPSQAVHADSGQPEDAPKARTPCFGQHPCHEVELAHLLPTGASALAEATEVNRLQDQDR
jgi:hypothetical protein